MIIYQSCFMVYFLKIEVNVDCFFFSRRWRQSQRKLRTKQEPLPPGLRTLGRYAGLHPGPRLGLQVKERTGPRNQGKIFMIYARNEC